jgi:hypothetical protein
MYEERGPLRAPGARTGPRKTERACSKCTNSSLRAARRERENRNADNRLSLEKKRMCYKRTRLLTRNSRTSASRWGGTSADAKLLRKTTIGRRLVDQYAGGTGRTRKNCASGHVRNSTGRPREQTSRLSGGRLAVRDTHRTSCCGVASASRRLQARYQAGSGLRAQALRGRPSPRMCPSASSARTPASRSSPGSGRRFDSRTGS